MAASEAYASYQFKWERGAADYQPNTFIKLLRFNANPDFYDSRLRSYTSLHFGPTMTAAGYSWEQVTGPEPHDDEITRITTFPLCVHSSTAQGDASVMKRMDARKRPQKYGAGRLLGVR